MAIIYAPKTGKATLRESASTNSRALTQLTAGTIVIVLDREGRFTKVSADGKTGYILTDALEMLDLDQLPLGEGMLIYPTTGGRGTTTINVRCDPSTKARKIDAWPTGTMVVVWAVSDNGRWYEIEHDGARCYVQAQYLTLTTLYDYSAAEETMEADAKEAAEAA